MEMFNEAGTIGIFCIFAILVLREVLYFIGKHPTQNGVERALHTVPSQCPLVTKMEGQIKDIHSLHMATDDDGVAVLPRLARNSRQQTVVLEQIRDALKDVRACPLGDEHGTPPARPA